ncbi:MAG: hypothetical protein JWQ02_3218 [Capsulimonas sp.]|nr:hypothetical protein [Capsulimonas sp.]
MVECLVANENVASSNLVSRSTNKKAGRNCDRLFSSKVSMHFGQIFAQHIQSDEDRWTVIQDFIDHWYSSSFYDQGNSDLEIDQAEARLGLKLPKALRTLYARLGTSLDQLAPENSFSSLETLKLVDELLIMRHEAQWVFVWGIQISDLLLEDPPVYLTEYNNAHLSRERFLQNSKTSEFILQAMIQEALFSSRYCANSDTDHDVIQEVSENFIDLGLPIWRWPEHPTMLYGGENSIIQTDGDQWIWAASQTKDGFNECLALQDEWEHIDE